MHSDPLQTSLRGPARLVTLCLALCLAGTAMAGAREQAKRIHDRIAGVPPSAADLDTMATLISNGSPLDAALLAVEHPGFYNATLKTLVTPMTNEALSPFEPLNDYTATVIGIVRDERPYTDILSADVLYIGDPALGLPAYSVSDNAHYEALEAQGMDLKTGLVARTQSSLTGLPAEATAGVLTTRAAARAFFIDGTNRAMFRFTLLNHLCTDLEQIKDPTRPHDRVRQDVSRSPGGDSRIFMNACVGCHAGMDPMVQAFAYYDYDYPEGNPDAGRLVYTPGRVQDKYLINANNFKYGYVTTSDRWDNYWRQGPNQLLGWDGGLPGYGNGAKSLGQELAATEAFAECQASKVFRTVCLREPVDATDRAEVAALTASFKSNGYNLKRLFAEAAVYCMGD